jgi:hypothetical protein
MTPVQRALKDLGLVTLAAIVGSTLMQIVISYMSVTEVVTTFMFGLLVYTGYNLFRMRVDHYQRLDELNKTVDKSDK